MDFIEDALNSNNEPLKKLLRCRGCVFQGVGTYTCLVKRAGPHTWEKRQRWFSSQEEMDSVWGGWLARGTTIKDAKFIGP
mgnify:CR=1 FL=1